MRLFVLVPLLLQCIDDDDDEYVQYML